MVSLYELLSDKNTDKSYNKNKVKYSDVEKDRIIGTIKN